MIFDNAFGIYEKSMQLRAERSEVLAANLANAETPGYKARDFDFHAALKGEMQLRKSVGLTTTHTKHIEAEGSIGPNFNMQFRVPHQASLDGNTVEAEREQVEFGSNALSYQASLRFLDGRIKGLITAIKGQGQ